MYILIIDLCKRRGMIFLNHTPSFNHDNNNKKYAKGDYYLCRDYLDENKVEYLREY